MSSVGNQNFEGDSLARSTNESSFEGGLSPDFVRITHNLGELANYRGRNYQKLSYDRQTGLFSVRDISEQNFISRLFSNLFSRWNDRENIRGLIILNQQINDLSEESKKGFERHYYSLERISPDEDTLAGTIRMLDQIADIPEGSKDWSLRMRELENTLNDIYQGILGDPHLSDIKFDDEG